jgi:hypothetical protein
MRPCEQAISKSMWRAGNIATHWNDLRHRKETIVQGQMREFDLKDLFAAILSKSNSTASLRRPFEQHRPRNS